MIVVLFDDDDNLEFSCARFVHSSNDVALYRLVAKRFESAVIVATEVDNIAVAIDHNRVLRNGSARMYRQSEIVDVYHIFEDRSKHIVDVDKVAIRVALPYRFAKSC